MKNYLNLLRYYRKVFFIKHFLKIDDRLQLEAGYQTTHDKRTANHINILLLLDDGYSYEKIASILRFDDETIRRHKKAYFALGLNDFFKNPFKGGTCKLSATQIAELDRYLEQNLCETTAQVVAHVASKCVDKTLNSENTVNFLKLIEGKNKDAHKIVLFVDNARYFYNEDVMQYVTDSKQLEMVFLPLIPPI